MRRARGQFSTTSRAAQRERTPGGGDAHPLVDSQNCHKLTRRRDTTKQKGRWPRKDITTMTTANLEKTVGDMFAAEWIHSPEIASNRDGAMRPSTKQLIAARLFILSRDDVFSDAQRAAADAWRAPQ